MKTKPLCMMKVCALAAFLFVSFLRIQSSVATENSTVQLDRQLISVLRNAGFTGRIESTLPTRLGRPVNTRLANLGRLLFFDNILGLHKDNSCAGCHSPAFSFGDTQSIAIGVDSNRIVGSTVSAREISERHHRLQTVLSFQN